MRRATVAELMGATLYEDVRIDLTPIASHLTPHQQTILPSCMMIADHMDHIILLGCSQGGAQTLVSDIMLFSFFQGFFVPTYP